MRSALKFDKYSITLQINSSFTVLEKRMGRILYHSDQRSTNMLKDESQVPQWEQNVKTIMSDKIDCS